MSAEEITEEGTGTRETRGFETEVRQLLNLMVHSLYGNKEIFLRELISNASDAADKLRFEALSNDALYEGQGDLAIELEFDQEARTLAVRDNGVGMGYQEVVDNLGTIARSGTRQFFDSLTGDTAKDSQLIGQFGVGFYSCFIVADKVTVNTRRAGLPEDGGVRWESAGEGDYTIERINRIQRGTEVVLHLKPEEDEFLDGYRLRSIIRRYSDHISLPIRLPKEVRETGGEDAEEQEAGGMEVINTATALWTRSKSDISDEEYDEFYKHVAHDFEAPLLKLHSRVEGNLEYSLLLFVPNRAPFDLWDRNVRRGVKLYVRRIFIMDDADQLMPPFLRFVRGVVDCPDLPLNVSREILQQNRQIEQIRSGAVKRVLDSLAGLAKDDEEKYGHFWDQFGRVFKEGLVEDPKNKEAIAKLVRFASTRGEGETQRVSLEDYVQRMSEGQTEIYYITADNYLTARNSPHLEAFESRGIEVLLLVDEIDEWVVHHLEEFDGKKLRSVSKGELDLSGIGKEPDGEPPAEDTGSESTPAMDDGVIGKIKTALSDRVEDVRTTDRLTASPACLVAGEHEMGARLERMLKAAGQSIDGQKPVLEINPGHALINHLAHEADDRRVAALSNLLFEQAVLAEGGRLEDPAGFVRRVNELFVEMAAKRKPRKSRKKAPKAAAGTAVDRTAVDGDDAKQDDGKGTEDAA